MPPKKNKGKLTKEEVKRYVPTKGERAGAAAATGARASKKAGEGKRGSPKGKPSSRKGELEKALEGASKKLMSERKARRSKEFQKGVDDFAGALRKGFSDAGLNIPVKVNRRKKGKK